MTCSKFKCLHYKNLHKMSELLLESMESQSVQAGSSGRLSVDQMCFPQDEINSALHVFDHTGSLI